MTKFTISLATVLLAISTQFTQAQTVTEKAARTCAITFFQMKQAAAAAVPEDLSIISATGITVTSPEIYIFNHPQKGFVIVSGEQTAAPIIGYSLESSIPASGWNDNFAYWVERSINQVKSLRTNATKSNSDIDAQWSFLLSGSGPNPFQSSKAILPLLRSTWSQSGFFNDMCPSDAQGEALVGCVATAMSQIMYYYRYPNTGLGTHSYNADGYGTQSVNFGTSTYNFNEMQSDLTFPAPEVAELCYHAGVSVDMSYGYDASGAFSWDVEGALESHFRYSSDASYKNEWNYTSANWKNLLKTNIDALHPVYYSGSGASGGHAFIIDGYEGTDYFHFDWGWGGSANGYYYIGSLNPSGYDFNDDNQAVVSIYPPTSSYPYGCSGSKTLGSTFGTIEDGSGPAANYVANANCSWLISPEASCDYFKIDFTELDLATSDEVTIYAGPDASSAVVGTYSGSTIPAQITVNSNKVFIVFTSDASNQSKGFLLNYFGHIPLSCTGIQTLTAATDTFDDGSGTNFYGNTSFCRWNINPPGATSITLHFLNFAMGDEYDYVKVTDAISGAVAGQYYKGDNPTTVTVNSTKMTVMFMSNASLSDDGFEVFYTITTDLNEQPAGVSMLLYPNPANDFLNIVPGDQTENAQVVIYDFSGRKVFTATCNNEQMIIPLEHFATGIYQVGLISAKGNVWQKLVIE